MQRCKLLQVFPPPAGLTAVFVNRAGDLFTEPVVLMALCAHHECQRSLNQCGCEDPDEEDSYRHRMVHKYTLSGTRFTTIDETVGRFLGFTTDYAHERPDYLRRSRAYQPHRSKKPTKTAQRAALKPAP